MLLAIIELLRAYGWLMAATELLSIVMSSCYDLKTPKSTDSMRRVCSFSLFKLRGIND